jgi:hypothetical protein
MLLGSNAQLTREQFEPIGPLLAKPRGTVAIDNLTFPKSIPHDPVNGCTGRGQPW